MESGLALFKTQVRDILVKHCLDCHGGKKTEGDLSLVDRDRLLAGGASGPAIVPGKAAESSLYKLVAHQDEPGMPFERPRLSEESIAVLGRWIDLGAPYDKSLIEQPAARQGRANVTGEDRQFWSFRPLSSTDVPVSQDSTWCRTPIDRFIMGRLESAGLRPNLPVGRRQLIRRAYLDLIGLPPEPAEIDQFVNDPDPQAYDKLIDRLLASPHYGERWARHWLDLARYAESHGYEQDYDRPYAFHYRDFVIRALNQDMPFDRFVRLQIAGDEIEPDNPQAMCATGFLGAGTHATQITANQVEKERYDELDDIVNTIGTAVLGLSIGCARCHDHKFDPIPSRDYYRLLATFTTTVRSEIDLDLNPERYRQAKASFDAAHEPLVAAFSEFQAHELPQRLNQWLVDHRRATSPTWLVAEAESAVSQSGATLALQQDGSYLASGNNADSDVYTFVIDAPLPEISALRIEALADSSLPKSGPGRAENGNFALSGLTVTSTNLAGDAAKAVNLDHPRATFEQKGFPVEAAIDANSNSAWAIDPQIGRDQAAVFEFTPPLCNAEGSSLKVVLHFGNNKGHSIGRLRLALSTELEPALDARHGSLKQVVEVNRILALPAKERSAHDQACLLAWFAMIDPEAQRLAEKVATHLAQAPKPDLTKVMVTSEGYPAIRFHTQGADFFEQTYILKRGDLAQKEEVAAPGFLQVLVRVADAESKWQVPRPEGSRTSGRRQALANWIMDVNQGAGSLAARVIVNRLWQHHFGRGIVATPSDFGSQGQRPSHPELLEWLAGQLVAGDWRLKPLHKLMMTSSVYLESVETDPQPAMVDRENALFWHRNRQRLEAEVIRDAMLAASGLLDRSLYGPGTLDEDQRRRSIYFFIKRSKLIPLMMLFDAPESLSGIAARPATTIAPQALALVNNAQLFHCAAAMGEQLLPPAKESLDGAITTAYLRCLGRRPESDELAEVRSFVVEQVKSYSDSGQREPLAKALADLCQSLFCLNEFIYVE